MLMTNQVQNPTLESLDEQKLNRLHWRMVITAGTGFFTDAYDLFVIGVVTALLMPLWHLSASQIALLNGASLASAAVGAVMFGWFADKFGRKKMYGIEVLILFIGALLSAVSPSFAWLLVSRIIVGIGIGGDYPTSAVVASEYANRKNRGFLVLLVFAMQAVGLIIGPLFASLLMAFHLPHALVWRLLLAFGALPAASVFYLRRRIAETPRFLLNKSPVEVSRVVSDLAGHSDTAVATPVQKLFSPKWLKCLIGTAGAWFLLDVALYGNGVSSVLIMKAISPHASLLKHTLLSALIFLCFAVPGYFSAATYVDKIGRKTLQIAGFVMMGLCYLLIAGIPHISDQLPLFVGIFGISFFFINFGPNATTFLIPSEIYPIHLRARAHGLSAAVGKAGAFIGAFFLPLLLNNMGLAYTMAVVAIASFLGIFATFLVPEMKGVSLEKPQ
ncbi:MFS transporter [Coxiella burnetii]|uniref:MFS transporter n=1 Tax=Coxiella burnetii TaxID=777 RepID=UPI000592B676|nr:MFS transporter [Coxiella burnetii]AML48692.1 MFS transporter [Coxiella burnetii]AML54664.1 MFS transporter [Coxiella burnetii]ATN68630.1 MFS transporter [Coxiella burnetii]ATN70554.1 MFS transporter [Coxiella burnetii]ATN72479.1 MFS transporter [Coxiella burnetii]